MAERSLSGAVRNQAAGASTGSRAPRGASTTSGASASTGVSRSDAAGTQTSLPGAVLNQAPNAR